MAFVRVLPNLKDIFFACTVVKKPFAVLLIKASKSSIHVPNVAHLFRILLAYPLLR
jgi:hypothetical protein